MLLVYIKNSGVDILLLELRIRLGPCVAPKTFSDGQYLLLFRIRIEIHRQTLFELCRISSLICVKPRDCEREREKMIFRRLLIFSPLDQIVLHNVLEIIWSILFLVESLRFFPMDSFSEEIYEYLLILPVGGWFLL
jgi:hypothetical protein